MLGRNLFLSFLLLVLLLSALVKPAYAVTAPTFPVCANPQGEVIVSYADGIHGVPGDSTTFTGQDTVYKLSDATLTQCLCTVNGGGIQTNWWKVSSLTQDEKAILINQGWILIPDGSVWGLEAAPYLAQNISYSCGSTSSVNSVNLGGPGDGLSDGRSDGGSTSPQSIQAVLGASTQAVLGLASTGNILFILTIFILGFALVGSGIFFSFKKRQ